MRVWLGQVDLKDISSLTEEKVVISEGIVVKIDKDTYFSDYYLTAVQGNPNIVCVRAYNKINHLPCVGERVTIYGMTYTDNNKVKLLVIIFVPHSIV